MTPTCQLSIAAALAVFLKGVVTLPFNLKSPLAFSTAFLVIMLRIGTTAIGVQELLESVVVPYVLGIAMFDTVVQSAIHVWHERDDDRRAELLYQSTNDEDIVRIPMHSVRATAGAMLDFSTHLAGSNGRLAACPCIGPPGDRRSAESMLSDLVETVSDDVKTRISRQWIERFLEYTSPQFDLDVTGPSADRSTALRFVSYAPIRTHPKSMV